MKTPFQKNLVLSAAAHVVALGVFMLVLGFSHPEKPPETIQWIDINAAPVEPGPSARENPLPPEPGTVTPPEIAHPEPSIAPVESEPVEPTPQHVEPEPVTPVKQPDVKPKPVEKRAPTPKPPEVKHKPKPAPKITQPAKQKIKISTKRVVIPALNQSLAGGLSPKTAANSSANPSFSGRVLAKFKNNDGLVTPVGAGGTGTRAAGAVSKFAAYHNLIYQELYGAWQPPFGMDEEMGAKVLLRIGKNGVISMISLAVSSGNKALDDSALEAPRIVKKLPPLPEGMGSPNPYAEVIVFFKIQKS